MPLVSVGLPTYNRAQMLERAVRSILAQTHTALEVVISDNASSDDTPAVARARAAGDPRIRYLRADRNRGPVANFNAVIGELRGDYAMLLADDDWVDADYIERCLTALRDRRGYSLVSGLPRYVDGAGTLHDGLRISLEDPDPGSRVRRYLRHVDDNGIFYGLMRRELMVRCSPMRDVLGADWLFVAGAVHAGRVTMLDDTSVYRTLGGTSRSIPQILSTVQDITWARRRLPYVHTVIEVFKDVAWRSSAYASAGPLQRVWLAIRAAPCAMRWKGSLWLIAGPPLKRLSARRHGGWLRRPLAWAEARGGDPGP
jgi:glycosyltransferase involved in cell wall biosynthesis